MKITYTGPLHSAYRIAKIAHNFVTDYADDPRRDQQRNFVIYVSEEGQVAAAWGRADHVRVSIQDYSPLAAAKQEAPE